MNELVGLQVQVFGNGNEIFFTFPTTIIPNEAWSDIDLKGVGSYGGVRTVKLTFVTLQGKKKSLFIKHPEYRFSRDEGRIRSGDFWWGGSKSAEKCILHKGLEAQFQVFYEALILCKLAELGIRAELPQAVVQQGEEMVLVTLSARCDEREMVQYQKPEIMRVLYENHIVPVDFADHNLVFLGCGKKCIIDVNRWLARDYMGIRDLLWSFLKRECGLE